MSRNAFTTMMLLSGLALGPFAGAAMAQQPTQAQIGAIKQSCRSDYQSYCSSVPTGGSASLQCLQQHLDALSPPCQSAVSALSGGSGSQPPAAASQMPPQTAPSEMTPRQKAALMRRSCGEDFHAYCAGVPLGGGKGMACLAQNESRLSPSCKGALAQVRTSR